MRKNRKKVASTLIIGLALTIVFSTVVGAKTVNKQGNAATRMCRMASVEPGEIPVTQ